MDFTMICYKIGQYVVAYNLVLFFIWFLMVRHEGGKASGIYKIVMILFAARLFGIYLGIHARSLNSDYKAYIEFMTSTIWGIRLLPETVVYLVLALVLTRRFIKSYLFQDPAYTRKNGNRKTDKE